MKKFLQNVAVLLHPRYATILRAAKNVRAGQEDSLPLRKAWRFYMLSWQGKTEFGQKRAEERHAEIERLYSIFAEPKSNLRLYSAANWMLKELMFAGANGLVFIPSDEQKALMKQGALHACDESQDYAESTKFLQLLKKAALHPVLYSAIYSKC